VLDGTAKENLRAILLKDVKELSIHYYLISNFSTEIHT